MQNQLSNLKHSSNRHILSKKKQLVDLICNQSFFRIIELIIILRMEYF